MRCGMRSRRRSLPTRNGKFNTLQGEVAFDENGDIRNRVVSVYQITKNDKEPLDDVNAQFKYIGVAPTS